MRRPLLPLVRVRLRRLRATGSIVRDRGGVGARGVCRRGVGSRFRGNDAAPGIKMETGRVAPRLWRYGAEWIPAYAGIVDVK